MEENTTATAEVTTPDAEAPDTAGQETSTAEEAPAADTDTQNQEPDTTPDGDEGSEQQQEEAAPITIPVKFNKQSRELSIDEATAYAQKGMRYDEVNPLLDKLRYLGASTNRSLAQVVDDLYNAGEQSMLDACREKAGDDDDLYQQLVELNHNKRKDAFDKVQQNEKAAAEQAEQQEKEDLTSRLSTEFIELQKEFPEVKDFASVPANVKKAAADKGMNLLDAYLRYQHAENKKINATKAAQAAAAKGSTGKIDTGEAATDTTADAIINGIWGR